MIITHVLHLGKPNRAKKHYSPRPLFAKIKIDIAIPCTQEFLLKEGNFV
jgi:hypothetical protein